MKFGNVNIRPFTENDILNKVRWINDCENNKFLHYELPLDEDKTRAWFHKNKDRADRYDAIIEYYRNPVGVIGLLSIVDGRAEYYICRLYTSRKAFSLVCFAKSISFCVQ